jgi:hypothetical protein
MQFGRIKSDKEVTNESFCVGKISGKVKYASFEEFKGRLIKVFYFGNFSEKVRRKLFLSKNFRTKLT